MSLFVWVKPAAVPGSPVDHTWVTTYDSGSTMYGSLSQVTAVGEHYWFCRGHFHPHGVSKDYPFGRILRVPFDPSAMCLVPPDDERSGGIVHWYGIDGVCHQVSNQVLFALGQRVEGARGYRLSSAIFGTFGRRSLEWQQRKEQCQVGPVVIRPKARPMSLLYRRAMYFYAGQRRIPYRLETLVRALHRDIDEIGFAMRKPNETPAERVKKLNGRISDFLREVATEVASEEFYSKALGIEPYEEINLIDPELFVFPDPGLRPDR